MNEKREHHRLVIIGAGIAGVGLGVRLLQAGIDDFVICERNGSVGGTWFEHTYPGCGCDVPTHLYSYSFARNPNWSRLFPRQDEILDYVRQIADDSGVTRHIRFETEMLHSEWDEEGGRWKVYVGGAHARPRRSAHAPTGTGPHAARSSNYELTCDVLVTAIGATAEPDEPDIPGLQEFQGHRFHSARWDHAHSLEGERVAVIGTGPAAAQFVPRIQPRVEKLTVFQRTPPWVIPHPDRRVPGIERLLYRMLPQVQDLQRNVIFALLEAIGFGFRGRTELIAPIEALGRAHLRRQIKDPDLRAKLMPRYRFGCKRPILSNTFYPALAADNAEVVTDPIRLIDGDAIVTATGARHELDTIIVAIGYRYNRSLLVDRLAGVGGRTLGEVWDRSPRAYLGSSVPGFPNMFILLGPNSIGINSVIFSLESQIHYVMSALRTMDRDGLRRVEVRAEALDEYVTEMDHRSDGSVWTDGGCKAYYTDDNGRNYAIYPGFVSGYRRRTRRFDADRYDVAA